MIVLVFWIASLLVVYPYAIYPVLLRAFVRRSGRARPGPAADAPSVTLVISAHNEESVIAAKLSNARSLRYPADKLEIIVVSDASTDRTDDLVREIQSSDARVRLLRQPQRRGKSAGLNAAVESARGDIIVFSDANAMYEQDAVAELVGGFADPRIGYVVGAAFYEDAQGNRAAENEGLYWKLELYLKRLESEYDSVVGGDGAIYAIRRRLFEPLRDDDISDFVNPLQIVAAGYRGAFNERAICRERAGESFGKEFGRKRRIVNRSWRAFRRYAARLSLRRNARFLFMLISHKVVRWFALPLILGAWTANALLLPKGLIYQATWCAITASMLLAAIGAILDRHGRRQPSIVATLYYFYLVNIAGLLGIWDDYRGRRHVTWDHVRHTSP